MSPTQFPIALGTIGPGATVTTNVTFNMVTCSVIARLKLAAPVSAMEGTATTIILRGNEPR